MALNRVKTWANGETLTHSDLNAEFDNIINNSLSSISPLTNDLNFNGNRLTNLSLGTVSSPGAYFNSDSNTGFYSTGADTVDIATGGVRGASFGASFLLAAAPEDARTNSVDVTGIIRSTTSGIPAANIGTGLQFDAESADENPSTLGRLDFVFTNVTAASEDSVLDILLRTAGAAEAARYRFQATGANLVTFTHAATASRTITIPDETGTLLTSTGHNVAVAVHGLPASVNFLGNRNAAGEFVQRGSVNPAALSATDSPMYGMDIAITFAVAFSSAPFVMFGGTTDASGLIGGAQSITTTGFTMTIFGQNASQDFANLRWTALGA